MKRFLIYFLIGLSAQVLMHAVTLLTGIADGVMYVFYIFPWIALTLYTEAHKQFTVGSDGQMNLTVMLGIPSIIYAVVLSLIGVLIKSLRKD